MENGMIDQIGITHEFKSVLQRLDQYGYFIPRGIGTISGNSVDNKPAKKSLPALSELLIKSYLCGC